MNIISFFVKNAQFTLVVVLMIVVVSVTTVLNMPRAEDPEINPPQFPIVAVYPGASPKDMEELVVKPIEERVSELENIDKIISVVNDGVAVVEVMYNYGSDVESKYQELVREMNSVRSELPGELHSLEVKKATPTDVSVLQVALVSENAPDERMEFFADRLTEELKTVNGLKKIKYWGVTEQEVRVELDLEKIARRKIPLAAVIGSIRSEAANIPGGSVRAGSKVFNVKTTGRYKDIDDIKNTVVYESGGSLVYLRDVAEVKAGAQEQKHITRINGRRCVLVTAAQKAGENIAKTQEGYLPVLAAFEKELPANIMLVRNFDQAENVSRRFGGLGVDFVIAIGLVLITLLPLGWRSSLIVMVAIPLSLGIGIVMLDMLGFSLNQLSIVGLVVALGLLVDDSIVVVENIERWLREGKTKQLAVIDGTKQITLAVLGCTATLIVSFVPLAFMPKAAGEFIRGLPVAVITSVFASMIVSLTIVPFLAARVLKTQHNAEGNIFLRALKRVISGSYAKVLDHSLRRPRTTLVVAFAIFGASLTLFGVIGFRLFPTSEKPQFLINLDMPLQTNLETTDSTARMIENELAKDDRIRYYTTNVGHGNPRIYYNVVPETDQPDLAQFFVQLYNDVTPSEKREIIEDLRVKFKRVPGAKIEVKDFEQGPPVEAPVAIRVSGSNLDTLRSMAAKIENTLRAIPGAIYVKNEVGVMKSDLRLNIDKDKSRSLGVQAVDIGRTVRLAVAGVNVGNFTDDDGDDFDIVVSSAHDNRRARLNNLEGIYVNNASGAPVSLNQIAVTDFSATPATIKHLNKKRFVVVTAFAEKGVLASDITDQFMDNLERMQIPEGYSVSLAGEAEGEADAFGGSFLTVVLATVFIFVMILILEFKTFKSTLIVLSVIPLGIIGGVMMLWFTGNPMSFVAIIGFIGLAGIEVKNSILLVDFTNQLREQGVSLDDAIRQAGEIRFLPIVLTTLTAIGGLLPIAISSNPLISPLALVLIGGLISSTALSRIVTPVVYKLIPPRVALKHGQV